MFWFVELPLGCFGPQIETFCFKRSFLMLREANERQQACMIERSNEYLPHYHLMMAAEMGDYHTKLMHVTGMYARVYLTWMKREQPVRTKLAGVSVVHSRSTS